MVIELTAEGRQVLDAILGVGPDRSLAIGRRRRIETPKAEDMYSLCNLLATDPREEELQQLLQDRPGFIGGLLGGPDNTDLAMIFKPPIGVQYRADFCVLQAHQGGAVVHLVEIESAHEPLFTKAGRTAKRLAGAMTQIEDWRIAVEGNPFYHAREFERLACAVPMFDITKSNARGFRLHSAEELSSVWRAFGGDTPRITYTIIIGRWSKLSVDEKARLLNRNRSRDNALQIFTYEQLARGANFRLERDDWYNDFDEFGPSASHTSIVS
jgi:hypothetical protein